MADASGKLRLDGLSERLQSCAVLVEPAMDSAPWLKLEDHPVALLPPELGNILARNDQAVVGEPPLVSSPAEDAYPGAWTLAEARPPHVHALFRVRGVPPRGLDL